MIKILSIGNSFSQDAQRYLHQIAANEGVELHCENLYYGGCSLEKHCQHIAENAAAYELECAGQGTGLKISILDALIKEDWDYVTIQQVSTHSFIKESYIPYLEQLASLVRANAPKAKLYIHQTWAYERDSEKLRLTGLADPHTMFEGIQKTYDWACEWIHADGLIPAGEAMLRALDAGIPKIHRDTFHADLGIGRYLLGCVWYAVLTGKKIEGSMISLDAPASADDLELVRNVAWETVKPYL